MQRGRLEMPDGHHTLCPAAPALPSHPCKAHSSRELLIEQLSLNKTQPETQMSVSELIGNRTQLQHNVSGPNSGLSYDLAGPVRAQGICILLCFNDFVLET